jgi:hypothetical protein
LQPIVFKEIKKLARLLYVASRKRIEQRNYGGKWNRQGVRYLATGFGSANEADESAHRKYRQRRYAKL